MPQRRWLLLLSVLCAFAGPASGQPVQVEWIDEQGHPEDTYLEMSRAYIRATDAAANTDPSTAETVLVHTHSVIGMDSQWVTLTETGPDTGVFEGWVDLGIGVCCPPIEEELDTGVRVENYQVEWDTLELTYGGAEDFASTIGSYTDLLDGQGNLTDSYPMGSAIHVRVREPANNNTADVESVTVELRSWAGGWDLERLTLTETGGDTGVFEGSIQTVESDGATAFDGIFQIPSLADFEARHDNRTAGYSYDRARMLSGAPRSVRFVDDNGQPVPFVYEFTSARVKVTDGAAAGQGQLQVRLTSELGGDTETVLVHEDASSPGTFFGNLYVSPAASGATPENNILETTEWSGPPHRFDTLRAALLCAGSPCAEVAEAAVEAVGSTTRLTDENGADVVSYPAGSTVRVEVQDYGIWDSPAQVTLTTTGGDSEPMSLEMSSYSPRIFSGSILSESGPPVPGDGRLQVQGIATLVATHANAQTPFSSSDSAVLGGSTLDFLDRAGNAVDYQLADGWARVRAVHPAGNADPGVLDTLAATIESKDFYGDVRDGETLALTETGPDTGIFTGQVELQTDYYAYPGDGILQTYYSYPDNTVALDTLTVTLDGERKTVPLLDSRARFIDAAGADATRYFIGESIRIQVESEAANPYPYPDYTWARVESLTTGEIEYVTLNETGPDTAIFEGQIFSSTDPPTPYDGLLSVQAGETVRVRHGEGEASDEAMILQNQPPLAGDDTATTDEESWVFIPVLANDSDPEGDPLFLGGIAVEPAHGQATIEPDNTIRYTPAYNYSGTDSFQYTVGDGRGESIGTVTITIQPFNDPPDSLSLTKTTPEDTVLRFAFEGSDPDGDPVYLTSFTSPTSGQLALDPDGVTFVYTPQPNFNGSASFTYDVQDPAGEIGTSSVTINVLSVQDPPVAVNDEATTAEDTLVSIHVRNNDGDADGDTVWISNVTQGAHGQVGASATSLNYMPSANYYGTDSFTYTINDGNGNYAMATVTVTITPAPDPPVAATDNVSLNEDTPTAIDVLANDSDPDGGAVSVTSVTQAFHGSVTIDGSGTLTYTPAGNYHGTDWFNYTIVDGSGSSATARVNLTIVNVNDPPNAVDDSVTVREDEHTAIYETNNDSDPDGNDGLTVVSYTQGAHGAVTRVSGWLRYTPAPNYNGPDTFTYTIRDFAGATDTATVTVTVTPVRDAPTAGADSATTPEDSPVTVGVLANDGDVDGDPLTVTAVTQGARGTVTFNAGSVTYTPGADFNGADSFTYTVSDGTGITTSGTVSITITPINDHPVAADDSGATAEDSALTLDVLANDGDVDDDALTAIAVTQGASGAVTFNNTSVTYTPAANFNGTDSFTYTASDGNGGAATATVTVNVTPVSDAPVAVADAVATNEDEPALIYATTNDGDPDGDPLEVTEVSQPANGTAVIDPGLYIRYTPRADFHGTDTFVYQVTDSAGLSSTAQITVTVSPVADPPEANDDAAATGEDAPVAISILGNDRDGDGDALSIGPVTQPGFGSVAINADRSVTYTPAADYNGPDSFTYTVSDGNGGTDTARVDVTVTAVNDPPVANDDSMTLDEDTYFSAEVLANDTDVDGGPVLRSVIAVTQGAHGTVGINPDSTVTYTPAADYNGPDFYTYTVSDGIGTDTATVSVTVNPRNDAPIAGNDAGSTNEDAAVTLSVLTNDSELDGHTLSIAAVSQGFKGSVTFNSTSVTYTPAANANGPDSFTYTVVDGNGGSATATVSITINPINDAPDAVNDSAATSEDAAVTIPVLSNDTDADGEALTITGVTQGTRGSVAQNANGTVTYTPSPNTSGSDTFTYTVRDAAGLTDSATVSVGVAAVNDPPDAIDDSAVTTEGAGIAITVLANDTDLEGGALTVTTVSSPAHGTATRNADNTISYVPVSTYSGADTFTYTISDGAATDTATVTIQVKDVIGNVAVLGTHSVWIQTGADVLSGDVVANEAGGAPFLNSTEVSIAGGATTAAGWDVQGNRVTIASGAGVASDVYYNQLSNSGSIGGAQRTPLSLPVFATLPAFQSASPGSTDVNVGTNGSRTLAPGSYRDLIVGRKGTVTFTGGTYHFRSIRVDREARLLFSAASTVRVQQRMSTGNLTTVGPGAGSAATAASIVFHLGGINGTGGGLAETPKAVEIGADNTLSANLYAPNGTIWLKDRTLATGAYLGRDVQVGVDAQVSLSSAW